MLESKSKYSYSILTGTCYIVLRHFVTFPAHCTNTRSEGDFKSECVCVCLHTHGVLANVTGL